MSQKTKYRVIGKKICLHLSSERGSKAYTPKTFLKGEEFEAFPTDVPVGFRDLVVNLGPTVLYREEKESTEEKTPFVRPIPLKKEEEFIRRTK